MPTSLLDICHLPVIDTSTTTGRLGWVPTPNCGRSTTGLLYSCLYTTFICIWSAIHPNVAKSSSTSTDIYFTRLGWLLLALFAPESVASYAIGEFYQARIFQKATQEMFDNDEKPRCLCLKYILGWAGYCKGGWPMEYCFLAGSGGIVVWEDGQERVLRYPSDLRTEIRKNGVAKLQSLPITRRQEVSDRIKSGPLIKILAILQISWFVAGIISRHVQFKQDSRNITTPEIMTAGIIVCTLIQVVDPDILEYEEATFTNSNSILPGGVSLKVLITQ